MKAGVVVPGLRVVDLKQGVLGMEWIEGWSVREVLGGGQEGDELVQTDEDAVDESLEDSAPAGEEEEDVEALLRSKGVETGKSQSQTCALADSIHDNRANGHERRADASYQRPSDALLLAIGGEIARMHVAEVIHGDLTTSNMMVRLRTKVSQDEAPFEVVRGFLRMGLQFSACTSSPFAPVQC